MSQPSYTRGATAVPLKHQTLGEMFDATVARYPDNEALVASGQGIRWSYRELRRRVDCCARALLALNIERDDRVAIWSPNNAQWLVIQLATARIGAILVTVNPAYRPSELAYVLKQAGIRCLVCADRFKDSDYRAMLYQVAPELGQGDPDNLRCAEFPQLRQVINLDTAHHSGMLSWQQFIAKADGIAPQALVERQAALTPTDAINIQYTSGTTGYPKGVTLSHLNLINNSYFVAANLGFGSRDRLVIPVPLYHCFGMVMGNLGCLHFGATMIYPGAGFSAEAVLEAIDRERATALYGVPTMFIAMLDAPGFGDYDLGSLRTGIMAGTICPIEVMTRVIEQMHMREVQIAYGMTETSPVSTQTGPLTPLAKRVTTVGRTQPHLETKIVDTSNGRTVSRGEAGELCTRGYAVMLGYWQDEAVTRAAIDDEGWMHSGDLAQMDEEGDIRIVGRLKDMVIRGGENIYPREVEEFLYSHPAVAEVQVTGVPDARYGEELVAWVRLHEGCADVDGETLRGYCRSRITHFKIPRYFKFVNEFPMTVTGKIQKYRMREISTRELGLGSPDND